MTPDDLARLTDWQVEHLYRRPQAGRVERARREAEARGGGDAPAGPPADPAAPFEPPSREDYVAFCTARLGWTADRAAAAYDEMTGGGGGDAWPRRRGT